MTTDVFRREDVDRAAYLLCSSKYVQYDDRHCTIAVSSERTILYERLRRWDESKKGRKNDMGGRVTRNGTHRKKV